MNKSYLLKCKDVSIRCNRYEILLARDPNTDSCYKECDYSVLQTIVNQIKDLVIYISEKSIIYCDSTKQHIYIDGRFCIIIFEARNTVYLTPTKRLHTESNFTDIQTSGVNAFLNQLNYVLWV